MVTYLVCDWLKRVSQSLIAGQNKQQKMLLSLRSNPQTMKPYIQEMMVCAPGQSITCSTTYCSTYGSLFVSRIAIT